MSDAKILDFVGKRKDKVEKKRRQFERVMFKNFLGSYSVLDDQGSLSSVELVDISHDGCLFQIPQGVKNDRQFSKDSEITLRIYFTPESYIPAIVKIRYGKEHTDAQGLRWIQYGCQFDKNTQSFKALESFVNFIHAFSEHSAVDKGDVRVFNF